MTEDVIEKYDNFNTKCFPEDLIFDDFNNQTIPSIDSDVTNDYDDDGTPIDTFLAENKGVEYSVVKNDKKMIMTALLETLTPN